MFSAPPSTSNRSSSLNAGRSRFRGDIRIRLGVLQISPPQPLTTKQWRRERDSNPRYPFGYSGFQDRPFRPLTHPSVANKRRFFASLQQSPCVRGGSICTVVEQMAFKDLHRALADLVHPSSRS